MYRAKRQRKRSSKVLLINDPSTKLRYKVRLVNVMGGMFQLTFNNVGIMINEEQVALICITLNTQFST